MDAERSSSPAYSGPPVELEARLQTAVEGFLDELRQGGRPDRAQLVAAAPELAPWLDERLRLVELVFNAGQRGREANDPHPPDDESHSQRRFPADRARRLKCPHCGNRVQLVEPRPKEVTCLNCGSSFRVEASATATYLSAGPAGKIGRFQILELLGRGAFGEVYKARDAELDRFVALKFPRADYFADSEEARRFLREARSAAGLRHPSIVQVHEIAHEGGSPYIVSDFIDGLTLADLISGGRPDCRESAELVAQLADALDYAHRQKVIHRDIKPSNILLALCGAGVSPATGQRSRPATGHAGRPYHNNATQFAPYLTDFGLARRDDAETGPEIAVTLDGQVLGTPAYMSPEQAAGDHARVDGRSDVYALGVVLYELLSGELPFRGSRRMLLHQVLHDEPRPPRTLNERIPRDLETICLKAMAKEPARRYATAADFRDDLRRYLLGDAIHARRVGRLERAWRWSRRNPTVAGLATSLAAALLIGTIVSSYFAITANELAVAEHDARISAEASEGKAIAAREQSERAAARALVAPLNADATGDEIVAPSEYEALWQLATLQGNGLWLRCIGEGTRDRSLATALFARSQPAMLAAVGLNLERRDRAAAFLLDRMGDTSLPMNQRVDIAFIALELVDEPGPLGNACIAVIREAISGSRRLPAATSFPWRTNYFWRARSHLEPSTLASLANAVLCGGSSADVEDGAAEAVAAAVGRLGVAEAERALTSALQCSTSPKAIFSLGHSLANLAVQMDPPEMARVQGHAAEVMNKAFFENANTGDLPRSHTDWMVDVATQLEPAAGAAMLTGAVSSVNPANVVGHVVPQLAKGLAVIATGMDVPAGSRACASVAPALITQMRSATLLYDVDEAAMALALVLARMNGENHAHASGEVASAIIEVLKRRPDWFLELAEDFGDVTAQLEPHDAARVYAAATEMLSARVAVGTDPSHLLSLGNGFASLASRLRGDDVKRLRAQLLLRVMDSLQTDRFSVYSTGHLGHILRLLSKLADGMSPAEAASACKDAARSLTAWCYAEDELSHRSSVVWSPAEVAVAGLADLAPHMPPAEAALLLSEGLRRAPGVIVKTSLAHALVAVTARMEATLREQYCAEVAGVVLRCMERAAGSYPSGSLVKIFDAALAQMAPQGAASLRAKARIAIIEAIKSGPWDFYGGTWPDALQRITSGMDRREVERLFESAVRAQLGRRFTKMSGDRKWYSEDEAQLVQALVHCRNYVASDVAWTLAQFFCSERKPPDDEGDGPDGDALVRFNDVLSKTPSKANDGSKGEPPRDCRLTTPQLVELLKMPTCFGPARRVILDHLERRYDRRFNTVWSFVRFAEAERLELDFTTPPVRPDPAKLRLSLP